MAQPDFSVTSDAVIKHQNDIIARQQQIINDNSLRFQGVFPTGYQALTMDQLVWAHGQIAAQGVSSQRLQAKPLVSAWADSADAVSRTPSEYSSAPRPNFQASSLLPQEAGGNATNLPTEIPRHPISEDYKLVQRIIREQHPGSLPYFYTKADIYQVESLMPDSNTARRMLVEDSRRKYEKFKNYKRCLTADMGVYNGSSLAVEVSSDKAYNAAYNETGRAEVEAQAKRSDAEFQQLARENELLLQIKSLQDQVTAHEINSQSLKRKLAQSYAEQKEIRDLNLQYCEQLKEMITKLKETGEQNKALRGQIKAQQGEITQLRENLYGIYNAVAQREYQQEEGAGQQELSQVLATLRLDKQRLRLENERLKHFTYK